MTTSDFAADRLHAPPQRGAPRLALAGDAIVSRLSGLVYLVGVGTVWIVGQGAIVGGFAGWQATALTHQLGRS